MPASSIHHLLLALPIPALGRIFYHEFNGRKIIIHNNIINNYIIYYNLIKECWSNLQKITPLETQNLVGQ